MDSFKQSIKRLQKVGELAGMRHDQSQMFKTVIPGPKTIAAWNAFVDNMDPANLAGLISLAAGCWLFVLQINRSRGVDTVAAMIESDISESVETP